MPLFATWAQDEYIQLAIGARQQQFVLNHVFVD
jgi:hypothetical protein